MKNKKLFIIVVSIQLVIALGIFLYIREKQRKVLGYSVNPINRENITISRGDSDSLKFFFEPQANKILTDEFDWLPKPAHYTINSDSLNERQDYTPVKPENTYRIITLGDSFTFGSFVDTKDNYPEQLEDILNNDCDGPYNFEVINLGVGGYDIQYAAERFVKRGLKYNPDMVIWLINYWDFLKIDELMMQRVQDITDEATKSGALEARTQIEGRYFAWTQAQNELFESMGTELLDKQFSYFVNFRGNYKGKLILVVFSDQGDDIEQMKEFNKFLLQAKNSDDNVYLFSGISYNALETLKTDPHPNVRDHKYIAGELKKYLTGSFDLPCN